MSFNLPAANYQSIIQDNHLTVYYIVFGEVFLPLHRKHSLVHCQSRKSICLSLLYFFPSTTGRDLPMFVQFVLHLSGPRSFVKAVVPNPEKYLTNKQNTAITVLVAPVYYILLFVRLLQTVHRIPHHLNSSQSSNHHHLVCLFFRVHA